MTLTGHRGALIGGAVIATSISLALFLSSGRGSARTTMADESVLLVAGDIAGCDTEGDEATEAILASTPGIVQTLGDNVYEDGTAQEFADCYEPSWGRHRWRTHPALGGHEYRTPGAAGYFGYFGSAAGDPTKGYYSYDQAGWHIVVLNGECRVVGCKPGTAQEQWLRADLRAHPARCTAAVLYPPRWSSGTVHGSQTDVQGLWQALVDGDVELVLSGDEHVYERFAAMDGNGAPSRTGTRLFVVGTGGRGHYTFGTVLPTSQVRNNDTFGVLRLTLHATKYDWRFLPEAGRTFSDHGSSACH